MDSTVNHLLEIRVILKVPEDQLGQRFYSLLFIVPKFSGGWRPILDLKRLNRYIVYKWFKMQSLQAILSGVRKDGFLTSIDLTEAYLHIQILPAHKKYLRFYYADTHY